MLAPAPLSLPRRSQSPLMVRRRVFLSPCPCPSALSLLGSCCCCLSASLWFSFLSVAALLPLAVVSASVVAGKSVTLALLPPA